MSALRLVLVVVLACVGLAAAQSEPFQGIVYSKGKFRGRSRIIPPDGWCWNLGVGLKDNVKSVRIIEGGHCEFYHEQNCVSLWEVYYADQPTVVEGLYQSVKCRPW